MLVATNNHKLVFAQAARTGERYYCPACGHSVYLRQGQNRVPHFAHRPGADCVVSEGETDEHLRGKQQLFDYLFAQGWQPHLEVFLRAINQRPDILARSAGQLVAVEFQCSPLTATRLAERNAGYRQLGIRPVWLLGQPYRHRLSSEKVAQFTQLVAHRPTLLYWDTARQRIEYQRSFQHCSFVKEPVPLIQLLHQQVIALAQGNRGNTSVQQLSLRAWATVQQPLAHCPLVCHDQVPSWPITRVAIIYWRIAVVLALTDRPLFSSWSLADWRRWLYQCGRPYWLTFACAPRTILTPAIDNLTADLLTARVILQAGGYYILFRHPRWFANLADKHARIDRAGLCPLNQVKLLLKER